MGNPAIFSGSFTKLLTSRGLLTSAGRTIDFDGAINYIANSGAEVDTTGWATYADAAANIPVDGTGGTATGLTFSRSTSTPLAGLGSFSLVQANSTSLQGKGVSYAFTIDNALQASVLSISFNYNASTTFVASNGTTAPLNDGTTTTNAGNSDIEVFLFDVTNSVLLPVSPQVITANGANNFKFVGSFQTSSNSTSYRLIFHVATTSANATGWTFKFDNVVVGPQVAPLGLASTDQKNDLTWTFAGLGTPTGVDVWYSYVGDKMLVQGRAVAGTTTATSFAINLPTNIILDSTKLNTAASGFKVGSADRLTTSGAYPSSSSGPWIVFFDGTITTQLFITRDTGINSYTKDNASSLLSVNDGLQFSFMVPIAGKSSNTVMSNEADTRVIAASYVSGADQTIATNATTIVNFGVQISDNTASVTTGASWKFTAPVSGKYAGSAVICNGGSENWVDQAQRSVLLFKNGSALFPLIVERIQGAITAKRVGSLSGSFQVDLIAGDFIDIRYVNGDGTNTHAVTFNTFFTNETSFQVERLSGPATIAASESVNARYFSSTTTISGSLATVVFATKSFDSHNAYNASTGIYTIPISGKYQVNASCATAGTIALNTTVDLQIQQSGSSSQISEAKSLAGGAVTQVSVNAGDIFSCLAGDTLKVQVSSGATLPTIVSSNSQNWFSIARVGN